ncbi:Serine/threonine kinase [Xylographa opegraphella]|nr:Serine/threonine kinase [Xylographa opegraphella]
MPRGSAELHREGASETGHGSESSVGSVLEDLDNRVIRNGVVGEGYLVHPVIRHEIQGADNDPSKRRWDLDSFDFRAVLGQGNAAKVMLAEKKASKELYAIKIQKKNRLVENGETSSPWTERRILTRATSTDHPFIVKLYATFQTETELYFVLEYLSGGDLLFFIQRSEFSAQRSQFYAAEVCLALKFLHENGILYRDLKLADILLAADGHVKLADFGHCEEDFWDASTTSTFCGNMDFIAPEMLLNRPYGRPLDWWAFGTVIYQMLYQRSPFEGADEAAIYDAIVHTDPPHPLHSAPAAFDIMQKLLARDPALRLGSGPADARDVMGHGYFQGVDWDGLYHKRVSAPFIPALVSKDDSGDVEPESRSSTSFLAPVVDSARSRAIGEEFRGF